MIHFDEPMCGLAENFEQITCNRRVSVTKNDAIASMRYAMVQQAKKLAQDNPTVLLKDFMANNNAWETEE